MKENGIEKLVGQRIKAAREAAGLSQAELAQKMGYKAASSITRAEKGRSDFPQSKIAAFAKALNVTPGFLLGDPLPVTLTGDTRRQVTPPDGARLAAILRQLQTDINKAIDAAVFAALHGDGYTATGDWSLDRQAVENDSGNSGTA